MTTFISAALIVFSLDVCSKFLLSAYLPSKLVVIPGFFNLVKVRNPGVAFGLFSTAGEAGRMLFIGLALAISVVLVLVARGEDRRGRLALGMIVGGALGNAWDRVFHGAVFDFLDFHLGPYHWPAFNLADASITLGVIFYLLRLKR